MRPSTGDVLADGLDAGDAVVEAGLRIREGAAPRAVHQRPLGHLVAAEDVADDVAHVDDHHAAAGEQHEVEVVVAAVAVGHQHVAQVLGGAAGDARDAARIAATQHPGAPAEESDAARRRRRRARSMTNWIWVSPKGGFNACSLFDFPARRVSAASSGSSSVADTGRANSLARLSGISIRCPMSGSTISRNFAGCAVETSTQRAFARSAGWQARVDLGRRGGVRAPDFPVLAEVRRRCARGSPASSTLSARTAPRMRSRSGNRARRRSMLLGLPTSMAEARVGTLARGRHSPVSRKSGTVRLALCASTMRPIGRPSLRAQTQATELPRLPLGNDEVRRHAMLRDTPRGWSRRSTPPAAAAARD